MSPSSSRGLLSVRQVAQRLGVSATTVYRLAERRLLPFYRLAASLRFAPDDVDAYLARQRVETMETNINNL